MDLGIKKIVDEIKEVYTNLDDGQVIELAKAEVLHKIYMHGLDVRLNEGENVPLDIRGKLDLWNSN